jgi:SNF2 family DNA or RNA helicase
MLSFVNKAHQYQKNICNYLIENPHCGVFLDMGMGKTAICLYAFKFLQQKGLVRKGLIIAPKFVALHTWKDEIKKWEEFKNLTINIAVGDEEHRLQAFETNADLVIINRDQVNWMMKSVSMKPFDLLIIDELSSFKNYKSIRSRSLQKITHRFRYRWGLTGTPAPNGHIDLFGQMLLIHKDILGDNFYSFQNKYFYQAGKFKYCIKESMKPALELKISTRCVSLSAKDYLDMPDKIENHIPVYLSDQELKIYKRAIKDLVYLMKQGKLDLKKNLTIKLQQLASGFIYTDESKNLEIVHTKMFEMFQEILDTTESNILTFYNFQAEKDLLLQLPGARELKTDKDLFDWNRGAIKLAICHPASLGYGMNLQAGGNTIIWYGYNWAADTTEQANARLYRQGQISESVVINYLYSVNTIHGHIRNVLEKKIDLQDLLRLAVDYLKSFDI